ncbi:MAG: cardiolipin synthase, partial [Muribaculaceae bacterium]|nr:cardiolipin synthase [Muribaculaceae bacterium]
ELRDAGVDVHPFFKVVFPLFATRINWRNHRKIAIIDGRSAYIGGMNIADRYIAPTWRDLHVRITGSAVSALQYCFAVDWTFMGQPLVKDNIPNDIPIPEKPMGIQLITSGPTGKWPNISMVFQRAIANARRRVYIMTPYFLPDDPLLRAMQTAALARVDVRILIPRNPDSAVMRHASFSYISQCLTAGMKVYLYEGGMLHTKALIIDYDMVSVGSTNFDFRSFEHNFEANILVYSQEFNARITEEFREACNSATRIVASEWHKRPLINRAIQSVVRLLAPIL